MRLFVAVPLPVPAAERVSRLLQDLRKRDWPVRWVRDGGLHVTLKFFGEITPDRLDAIAEAVRLAARGTGLLELALGTAGAFPTLERARVLWLGIRPDPQLELLQDRLERACEAIGYPPEGRPFSPHLTLGRVREGQRLPSQTAAILDGIRMEFPFRGDRVILYESRQTPQGPAYSELLVHRLDAETPA
jgi:2'-5' RNA ligase